MSIHVHVLNMDIRSLINCLIQYGECLGRMFLCQVSMFQYIHNWLGREKLFLAHIKSPFCVFLNFGCTSTVGWFFCSVDLVVVGKWEDRVHD